MSGQCTKTSLTEASHKLVRLQNLQHRPTLLFVKEARISSNWNSVRKQLEDALLGDSLIFEGSPACWSAVHGFGVEERVASVVYLCPVWHVEKGSLRRVLGDLFLTFHTAARLGRDNAWTHGYERMSG